MNLKRLGEKAKLMKKLTKKQLAELIDILQRNLFGIESGLGFTKGEALEKIITAPDSSLEEICSTVHLEDKEILLCKINIYIKILKMTEKS